MLLLLRPFFEKYHREYREPFSGGVTVFFNKNKADENRLNDLDHELITFYKVTQDKDLSERLIKKKRLQKRDGKKFLIFSLKMNLKLHGNTIF